MLDATPDAATATIDAPGVISASRFTDEQTAAIDLAAGLPAGASARVRSGAGTGKTTTLVGMARALTGKGVYVPFNRAVAEEARPKFADTPCTPMTFHGLCFQVVQDAGEMAGGPARYDVRQDVLDAGLTRPYLRQIPAGWNEFGLGLAALRTLAAFCMSDSEEIREAHARKAVTAVTGDPESITAPGPKAVAERALRILTPILRDIATAFWEARLADRRLTHDAYVKLVHLRPDLAARAFAGLDYVMVDEAQDLNPVQIAILKASGVSVIAVGDSAQSIYGWRGAVDALDRLTGAQATLSRSFRFGPGIAGMANRILDRAPELGGVTLTGAGGGQPLPRDVPGHAILARTNIGLLDEAEALFHRRMSYNFDRGEDLLDQVRSAEALWEGNLRAVKNPDIKPFRDWDDFKAEADANPTFARLVEIVEKRRVAMVARIVKDSRPIQEAKVALMTAHRSKGLEFGAVKLAGDWSSLDELDERHTRAEQKSVHKAIEARQEFGVLYVAVTRGINRVEGAESLL